MMHYWLAPHNVHNRPAIGCCWQHTYLPPIPCDPRMCSQVAFQPRPQPLTSFLASSKPLGHWDAGQIHVVFIFVVEAGSPKDSVMWIKPAMCYGPEEGLVSSLRLLGGTRCTRPKDNRDMEQNNRISSRPIVPDHLLLLTPLIAYTPQCHPILENGCAFCNTHGDD